MLKVTRSVLSPFRRNDFESPFETATKVINVVIAVIICPELEVQLSLMQPRAIPKRRRSISTAFRPRKVTKRRFSCAPPGDNTYF